MLIFGTRSYFRTRSVTQTGFCSQCEQLTKLRSYDAIHCFHVYFVPLIPTGGRKRYHQNCVKCRHGLEMQLDNYADMVGSLKETAADVVVALDSDDKTFEVPSEDDRSEMVQTDAAGLTAVVVDWLYAAGEASYLRELLQSTPPPTGKSPAIQSARLSFEAALDLADGRSKEAAEKYWSASQTDPSSVKAAFIAGRLFAHFRRYDEAIDAYRTAANHSKDDAERAAAWIAAAQQCTAAKRHEEAADAYAAAVAAQPAVAADAAIGKAIRKANKKAGRA